MLRLGVLRAKSAAADSEILDAAFFTFGDGLVISPRFVASTIAMKRLCLGLLAGILSPLRFLTDSQILLPTDISAHAADLGQSGTDFLA